MKIELENIGKIESASVELKGITVIAGKNSTGKSTVGKALFAMFNGLNQVNSKMIELRASNIESKLIRAMPMRADLLSDKSIINNAVHNLAINFVRNLEKYKLLSDTQVKEELISQITLLGSGLNLGVFDNDDVLTVVETIQNGYAFF